MIYQTMHVIDAIKLGAKHVLLGKATRTAAGSFRFAAMAAAAKGRTAFIIFILFVAVAVYLFVHH
jgi:hypothetical protein